MAGVFTYKGEEPQEDKAPGGIKRMWGTEFPKGVGVPVFDEDLAKKLRAMQCFDEAPAQAPVQPSARATYAADDGPYGLAAEEPQPKPKKKAAKKKTTKKKATKKKTVRKKAANGDNEQV